MDSRHEIIFTGGPHLLIYHLIQPFPPLQRCGDFGEIEQHLHFYAAPHRQAFPTEPRTTFLPPKQPILTT